MSMDEKKVRVWFHEDNEAAAREVVEWIKFGSYMKDLTEIEAAVLAENGEQG